MERTLPLFETKSAKGLHRFLFRSFEASILLGVSFIFVYRANRITTPQQTAAATMASIGLLLCDLWFAFYWFITVVIRWNPIYRSTFTQTLALRYEKALPAIDIFVCTADPVMEPPVMVMNTVLSVMAYEYPQEKLNVYLSDDGGSEVTFYALVEASRFAEKWLPFCRKFGAEPRSPEAYFRSVSQQVLEEESAEATELSSIYTLYQQMKNRIESVARHGRVSKEIRRENAGFREWDFVTSQRDHQTIIKILDGTGRHSHAGKALDDEGQPLPTLVYLAREKRPQHHHNFKAGAMNALIRVSSRISNSPVILNVDCDMYSNNSESVRDAMCVFMDEEKGHRVGFVQFPQTFGNITRNDVYSSSLSVILKIEFPGLDAYGGPAYIGTGCFHRRQALCGEIYRDSFKSHFEDNGGNGEEISVSELEDACKVLASCTYENNTQWGKEMGLNYGCPVEDVLTGLYIQCRGWRSVYLNPERKAFMGVAPTTLLQTLVQHKRWIGGDLQIFLSEDCPFLKGIGCLPLQLQISYCVYLLWAVNSLPTLFYVTVPSLCFLRGISLFPEISSPWCLPFLYVFFGNRAYSLAEYIWSGGTLLGWWNDQRMWIFKRTTAYLFGFVDNILRLLGFTDSAFAITNKVVEDDVSQRYEQEVMEFGTTSPMFTIIATVALLNAFSFIGGMKKVAMATGVENLNSLALQIILNGLLVSINLPVFQGLFFRKDKGRMPASVTFWSTVFALLACSLASY